MFLIDTMVLSETLKNRPHRVALEWLTGLDKRSAFVSVVTVGEIHRGIHKLEAALGQKPTRYVEWFDKTVRDYGDRILPVAVATAQRWGWLSFHLKNTNPDLLIAATALQHDLVIATRNTRHFEPTGAKLFNPYEA